MGDGVRGKVPQKEEGVQKGERYLKAIFTFFVFKQRQTLKPSTIFIIFFPRMAEVFTSAKECHLYYHLDRNKFIWNQDK